ncbi:radical SAM protein [Micromonospora sp. NPDC023966]|uniref:SPL family radical SAM protein n=1 Tax=Micromonospora sp. NPDC023966 TaxID=3154699 RepID=UPI00340C1B5F
MIKVKESQAKTMLVRSKLPDADFVVNPYTGCRFGCGYCYASFMGRFVGEPIEAWGDYVYVKTNAVEVLTAELARLNPAYRDSSVLLSSVTDPYQAAEAKYQLTRGILAAFGDNAYPGTVSLLTKAPMVTRDIDLLSRISRAEVGMTVTTTDDAISRWLEVRAPVTSRRLEALRALRDAGVTTYAFVGPLLPHFRLRPDLLDDLFKQLSEVQVGSVYVEHINLRGYIRSRLGQFLESQPREVRDIYRAADGAEHRASLDRIVADIVDRYGIRLRLDQVIHHDTTIPGRGSDDA